MKEFIAEVFSVVASHGGWGWVLGNEAWQSGVQDVDDVRSEIAAITTLGYAVKARGASCRLVRVTEQGTLDAIIGSSDERTQLAIEIEKLVAAWGGELPHFEVREEAAPQFPGERTFGHKPGALADPALRDQIISQEKLLLGPAGRNDPELLESLIHQDFDEIGRMGYYWQRGEVVSALQTLPHQTKHVKFDRVIELAPGVVHVRFCTHDDRGIVHRSSIWVHDDGRWQQRYHQGTPEVSQ